MSSISHPISTSKKECPLCRTRVEEYALRTPNIIFRNILANLITYCDNRSAGCSWEGEWSNLDNHLRSCSFVKVGLESSQNDIRFGVLQDVKQNFIAQKKRLMNSNVHTEQSHVNIVKLYTELHNQRYFRQTRKTQKHLEVCEKVPVVCRLCGTQTIRGNIVPHANSICPELQVLCPFAKYGCTAKVGIRR